MVLRGDFHAGERLSEVPVAERLGVSRTPVRLALERLALEGLLNRTRAGGFTVRTYTIVEIWDAIELRAVLEGTAARLAAERLVDSGELNELRRCSDSLDTLRDGASASSPEFLIRYADLNDKFHEAMIELSRSTILKSTLARLHSIPFAAPSGALIPDALASTIATGIQQHHAIIEAIDQRDGIRAEGVAREHARLARQNLETALQHSARYFIGQGIGRDTGAEIITLPTLRRGTFGR